MPPAGRRPKSRHLTVLLLSQGVRRSDDAFRNPRSLQRVALRPRVGVHGSLFIKPQSENPPNWLEFVEPHVLGPLADLRNRHASAVLIVDAADRKFAFTFGQGGRQLLRDDSWECDFGLKVTLNAVNPEHVRSVDVRTIQELTLQTRRQSSRSSAFETFGLDVTRDLLRAVTGEPRDSTLAARLTGADALALTARLEFTDLTRCCERLLTAYASTAYRERFSFIDDLKTVRDPHAVATLTRLAVARLRQRDTTAVHLAPAEPIEWEQVAEFRYSTEPENVRVDLDIEDYLGTVNPAELDEETVKTHRVSYRRADQEQFIGSWRLFACLVAEVRHDGQLYVLSGGQWFKLANDLADRVARDANAIPLAGIALPPAANADGEDDYNDRVGEEHGDWACLHKKLVYCAGRRGRIEACDVFTCNRQFVHVKPLTKSATLSHLFAQGLVSAEAFMWDAQYRADLKNRLRETNAGLLALVPDHQPAPNDFEVVYAIITAKPGDLRATLPFFSRLHLTKAAEQLHRSGFRVSIARIERRG